MAKLAGTGDDRLALGEAARERDKRQLIDRQRHLGGADAGSGQGSGPGDDRPPRLPARRASLPHLDRGAHPGEDSEQTHPGGVDPHLAHHDLASGDEQRPDEEEGRGREVSGDRGRRRLERSTPLTVILRAGPTSECGIERRSSESTSTPAAASIRSV